MNDLARFTRARDLLLELASDYDAARARFEWPALERFNWALDHFDRLGSGEATREERALVIVHDDGRRDEATFAELSARSDQVAALLAAGGVARGDRVLLMLPNVVELWLTMLACIKLGAVIVPATLLLTREDLDDRVARGGVRHVVTDETGRSKVEAVLGLTGRFLAGGAAEGWRSLSEASSLDGATLRATLVGKTHATDPLLVYFTSGTTAKPKLVLHTHQSYPVGHLTTMYWVGLRPGDVHWNISSPGWAKHAWSNVFAPWNAAATVFVHATARFSAARTLDLLASEPITTLCAPPTVWRMLVLEDLAARRVSLREAVAAGEPLNPEVITQVQRAWGLTVRDGFGQTETTALVGNSPGQTVRPGSMGRPLPGYEIVLLDSDGRPAEEGELSVGLTPRPTGVMVGYVDDDAMTDQVTRDGHYHTGDVARRDADGYVTYVGRADDVFKASDYRISPFELESVLVEHPAVAEAAVVPSPDPVRTAVPKAFVLLAPGLAPSAELAKEIVAWVKERVAPYKRIRRLEFVSRDPGEVGVTMPKTISGKIRRVELRALEAARPPGDPRRPNEHVDGE
ncbi:MAG: AMP-binding protein [Polyangiaceae bacterium]|nr:AMP-binding protein [Polyangiaceae bacterium]